MSESFKSQMFKPVQVGRASEDIALQIESAIISEKLKPGDGLPSERELQTQFGTGRGVIREAITALKQKGLIEIRKGQKGGAFVKHIEVSTIGESLALFLKQNHIAPDNVAEFRESIDHALAMLAMVRASESQKDQLRRKISSLENEIHATPINLPHVGEIDRELNLLLAEMADNPIFSWVMNALQQGFSSQDYALYQDAELGRQTVQNWKNTAQFLIEKDPLRLQASISHHYQLLRECIQRNRTPEKEYHDE